MKIIQSKTNAREVVTDLVLEFLEATAHELLFAWHVYPKESFERRVLYDVPIHMNRHPMLCEYINSMVMGCRMWLLKGELEKVCVNLLSKEGLTLEMLVIEPGRNAVHIQDAGSEEHKPLPLLQLDKAFRAGMVALVSTAASRIVHQTVSNKPYTFRILAQTMEDATNRETVINDDNVSNSWVLADPFWCDDRKKGKEMFPVTVLQSETSPIRINVYIEKTQSR